MRILGIDPGYERLGIAVLEKGAKESVLYSNCFKTDASLEFPERLRLVGEEIKRVAKEFEPEVLAIESLFLTNNKKTAMHVAEVRGVIIYEAKLRGLKIFEATPPQIKVAVTGSGSADKKGVIKMVKLLTKIDDSKTSDDELDAIAIALTASARLR